MQRLACNKMRNFFIYHGETHAQTNQTSKIIIDITYIVKTHLSSALTY